LYATRSHWQHLVPELPYNIRQALNNHRYSPIRGSFSDDAAAGLHSSTFDLSGNIENGDSRGGLDERGKREVQRIMKARGVGFDEARRLSMLDTFSKQGIGADGLPRDPKFVSFS